LNYTIRAPVESSGRFRLSPGIAERPTKEDITMIEQLEGLKKFRQEWEDAAEGASLLDLEAPVGLMLSDVCLALALDEADRLDVLGLALTAELKNETEPQAE
jgi:hypothetical protein